MVAELEAAGHITTPRVRQAFLDVPRELFVPEFAERKGLAAVYEDTVIVTREDEHGIATSSSSQPAIMALMLERLDVRDGQRVLEIGAGTGYNAALLSRLVGPRGRVVSLELDRETARRSRRALADAGSDVRVVCRDGGRGFAAAAPYDRIIATASADEVPRAWWEQLAPGGLLELPLRLTPEGAQAIPTLRKERDALRSTSMLTGGFMPLRSPDGGLPGEPPRLLVSDVRAGTSRPLLWLVGPALERLSERGRRRLVALALSEPRIHQVRVPAAKGWSLALYLSLETPRSRAVASYSHDEAAYGIVGRGGRGLALFGGRFKGPLRLYGYGEPDADDRLLDLVERWHEQNEPTEQDLEIEVRVGAGRNSLRRRWQTTVPRSQARRSG